MFHHRDTASFAFDPLGNSTPSETDEINLAPLIDVVFLLLFFMVTTTSSRESRIRVQLPEAPSAKKTDGDGKRPDYPDQRTGGVRSPGDKRR